MIFLCILLAHLFTEFLLNPTEFDIWKRKKYGGIFVHLAIVFLVYAIIFFFISFNWWLISFIAVLLYGLVDLLKKKDVRWLSNSNVKFAFPLFLTTQSLQVALIFIAALLLKLPVISVGKLGIKFLLIIDGILLVTIFASTFLDVLGRQSVISGKYEIESKHKLISIAERGFLFLLLFYNFYYIIPLIFIPRIYLQRLKVMTIYRRDLLVGTSFTFFVFVFIKSLVY